MADAGSLLRDEAGEIRDPEPDLLRREATQKPCDVRDLRTSTRLLADPSRRFHELGEERRRRTVRIHESVGSTFQSPR